MNTAMVIGIAALTFGQPETPKPVEYATLKKEVAMGRELVVYLKTPIPPNSPENHIAVKSFKGETKGVFRCYREGGKEVYTNYIPPQDTEKIVTIDGRKYHSHKCPYDGTVWAHPDGSTGPNDHDCPTCGRKEYYKYQIRVPSPTKTVVVPKKSETPKYETVPLYDFGSITGTKLNCPTGNCPNATPYRRSR